MPSYVYESLERPGVRFEFLQGLRDARLTYHPESGEKIRRVIAPGVAIRTKGLKRSARINKRIQAATACGCASNVALASAVLSNSDKSTPRYTVAKAARATETAGRADHHKHGGCSHGHK